MAKKGSRRTRNFACVVYEDSAPSSWQQILQEHFIPAFVSPYHDSDIDPQDQPKKPHWHVMLMFDALKTVDQAREVFESIGGVGCEIVESVRGYARYLCHLDNPDKFPYDPDLVMCFAGADYKSVIGLVTDKYKAICEMMQYCRMEKIRSYSQLMDYAAVQRNDWFRSLCDNSSFVMSQYLRGLEWEDKKAEEERLKAEVDDYIEDVKRNYTKETESVN